MPTLQIQPSPSLRFVEYPPVFDEAFLPALILMLGERAAEKVELQTRARIATSSGSTAAATLGDQYVWSRRSKADCSLRHSPCWWALRRFVSKA